VRDDRLRLEDIQEAIEQIECYSQRGRPAFDQDELIRVWILHHLEIIGEASSDREPAQQLAKGLLFDPRS
jgi:uncharacterized protein with HEPN domain